MTENPRFAALRCETKRPNRPLQHALIAALGLKPIRELCRHLDEALPTFGSQGNPWLLSLGGAIRGIGRRIPHPRLPGGRHTGISPLAIGPI